MSSQPPLLTLRGASLSFGGKPLFHALDLSIYKGERASLVGKNGCGKSTLLKILNQEIELDHGDYFLQPGTRLGYLPQDVIIPEDITPLEFVCAKGIEPYKAEEYLHLLDVAHLTDLKNISGGERRRLALARALAEEPDILFLDEPTNHLDLPAIEWLEKELSGFKGAFLVISHDRSFLERVSNHTLWLDRGILRENDKGYGDFERWSDEIFAEEERMLEKMDARLRLEQEWLHRGVTARRKRNQGRLRRLHDLRNQRKEREKNLHTSMKMVGADGSLSSRLIVETHGISKSYGDRRLIHNFTTRILRGDRIGIIGPNGSGKSTLVKILVGQIQPDEGRVRIGAKLDLTYFDQMRETLKPDDTLWHCLCPQGGDQVIVQGKPRHVVAYLKDFLFTDKQVKGLVGILSGGEKNRLALAKALAQECNVLVLDEPTNDLDMDTLDLLIDLLSDFEGTIITVSHDRDFLNKVVTSVMAFDEDGTVREYVGGYDDYIAQRPNPTQKISSKKTPPKKSEPQDTSSHKSASTRLSYHQKRLLETLPLEIEHITKDIDDMENKLASPEFYTHHRDEFMRTTQALEDAKKKLSSMEEQWIEISLLEESLNERG